MQPIALYGGPQDGEERTISVPMPKALVFEERCAVYMLSDETNRNGRSVYYFSQGHSNMLTLKWGDYLHQRAWQQYMQQRGLQGNT
jgi:hypothetical protein